MHKSRTGLPGKGLRVLRRNLVFQLILATILFIVLVGSNAQIANAENHPPLQFEMQTSDPNPVDTNKVAQLWLAEAPKSANENQSLENKCTANFLQGKFWITAKHCFSGITNVRGAIYHPSFGYLGVEEAYFQSLYDDVALLKVSEELHYSGFKLPEAELESADEAQLIGYGTGKTYPTIAKVRIAQFHDVYSLLDYEFHDIFETESVAAARGCGDSGGGIIKQGVIYAVHTGGTLNDDCTGTKSSTMWHTDLFTRREWIEETMRLNFTSNADDHKRALEGVEMGPIQTGESKEKHNDATSSRMLGSSY